MNIYNFRQNLFSFSSNLFKSLTQLINIWQHFVISVAILVFQVNESIALNTIFVHFANFIRSAKIVYCMQLLTTMVIFILHLYFLAINVYSFWPFSFGNVTEIFKFTLNRIENIFQGMFYDWKHNINLFKCTGLAETEIDQRKLIYLQLNCW